MLNRLSHPGAPEEQTLKAQKKYLGYDHALDLPGSVVHLICTLESLRELSSHPRHSDLIGWGVTWALGFLACFNTTLNVTFELSASHNEMPALGAQNYSP